MSLQQYDLLLITGCSHSCGMEMNDHLLPPADNLQMRQANIFDWGRKNLEVKSRNFAILKDLIDQQWTKQEKANSWPSMLEQKTGIRVVNLATIGASFGRSLLSYSNFLRNEWNKERTAVIHQVPASGRMCLRFDSPNGKVDIVPGNVDNFGYDSNFFKKEIKNVHERYKKIITNDLYIRKYNSKLVNRFKKLSSERKIDQFYIVDKDFAADLSLEKIIIQDFETFRKKYDRGKFSHPIGTQFNTDLSDLVIQALS